MSRERGQLLVTSALVIAVILIAVVIVLNGTMYVQNAGSGEGSAAAVDADVVRSSLTRDLAGLTSATAGGEGYADLDRLDDETTNFSEEYRRFAAGGSVGSVVVSLDAAASGSGNVTRLVDDGTWRGGPNTVTLVSRSEAQQYDLTAVDFDVSFVAKNVKKRAPAREFTVNVTDASTPRGETLPAWTLTIDRPPSGVPGAVEFKVNGDAVCTATFDPDEEVHVDLDDGVARAASGNGCTFDTSDDTYGFAAGISPPYGIELENTRRFVSDENASFDLVLSSYAKDIDTTGRTKAAVSNATTAPTYDLRYQSPSFDFETHVSASVPPHRTTLLVDDFEDGDLSPWSHNGNGSADVREQGANDGEVVHSGTKAAFLENTTQNNAIQRSVETGGFDEVVVSLWASSDAREGPNPGEDEYLVIEYRTDDGWAELGRVLPNEPVGTQPPGAHVYTLSGSDVPDDLELRFRQPDSRLGGPNTWYVDDVVVYGVTES